MTRLVYQPGKVETAIHHWASRNGYDVVNRKNIVTALQKLDPGSSSSKKRKLLENDDDPEISFTVLTPTGFAAYGAFWRRAVAPDLSEVTLSGTPCESVLVHLADQIGPPVSTYDPISRNVVEVYLVAQGNGPLHEVEITPHKRTTTDPLYQTLAGMMKHPRGGEEMSFDARYFKKPGSEEFKDATPETLGMFFETLDEIIQKTMK